MHRKTIIFSCALFCALTIPYAHAQQADSSISKLVQDAIGRNREILAVRQRIAEAKGLLRQAGVRPNPTLEVEGGTGRQFGTRGEEEFSAGYFHPVELGGKKDKRVHVAEISVSLAETELDERVRQLSFDIKSRAVDALINREKDLALERLAAVNQQAYELAEARVKEGDIPRLDAQLLLVEKNRTEAQRASLAGRLEAEFVELRRLVGMDSKAIVPLGISIPIASSTLVLEELQSRALEKRPDVRLARLLENQGKAEIILAEAQIWPDVTLSAKYILRNSAFDQFGLSAKGDQVPLRDRDNVLIIGASIPLFTGKRNQGNIDAATARATGNSLRKQHMEGSIPLEVEAAFHRYRAAKTALAVFSSGIVDQSAKNLQVIREAYQLGQLRLLDVINEQRRLGDTELAYIDAKAELAKSLIELERITGAEIQ